MSAAVSTRLLFLDAVRGFAALAVALFHFYYVTPVFSHWIAREPALVDMLLSNLYLGVEGFFVISGFVISLTLTKSVRDWRSAGLFILRRQVRLDPPYWLTIAASLASVVAFNAWKGPGTMAYPSPPQIVAHLFYAQEILGYEHIVGIFWTLCLEVQFYLVFLAMRMFLLHSGWPVARTVWLFLPLYLGSLFSYSHDLPELYPGQFLSWWYAFYCGCLLSWFYQKQISLGLLLLHFGLHGAYCLLRFEFSPAFCLLVALCFLLACLRQGLGRWCSGTVFQYFGRISYSLYLTHALIGIRLLKVVVKESTSLPMTLVWYLAALAISIAAADVFYRLVEKPSIGWSKRFSAKKSSNPPVTIPA